jgi:hypothetical protein
MRDGGIGSGRVQWWISDITWLCYVDKPSEGDFSTVLFCSIVESKSENIMSVTKRGFYRKEGDMKVESFKVREFGGRWSVNDESEVDLDAKQLRPVESESKR